MRFLVTDDIFEQYPKTQIGVVVTRGLDNTGQFEELTDLVRSFCRYIPGDTRKCNLRHYRRKKRRFDTRLRRKRRIQIDSQFPCNRRDKNSSIPSQNRGKILRSNRENRCIFPGPFRSVFRQFPWDTRKSSLGTN